jgi:antitoxin VapB
VALNIKNAEVERLVDEVADLTGESKTAAVRQALVERRERLRLRQRGLLGESFLRYLRQSVWPKARRAGVAGKRLSRVEEDEILGFGRDGV